MRPKTSLEQSDHSCELAYLGAAELTRRFREGSLSPVEVTDSALDRIARLDPALNAFARVTGELARTQARQSEQRWRQRRPAGPLDGVPFTVKDNVRVAGVPTVSGSATVPIDQPWDIDAPGVARLRAGGAVLLGITTMPEFAWKVTTDSPLYGISRNPWNLEHTPGGSSGGAAAAAAAGMGVLALATDGGGSIRVPASRCGVVGFKPTHGRVSDYPPSAFGTNSHVGPITRTVTDAALSMNVIAGRDSRDWYSLPDDHVDYAAALSDSVAGLRVAYSPDLGSGRDIDPEVADLVRSSVSALQEAGAQIEEIAFDSELFARAEHGYYVQRCVMQAATIRSMTLDTKALMDPELLAACEQNVGLFTAFDLHDAEVLRRRVGSELNRLLDRYDLLATPVVHTLPERVDEPAPQPFLTALFNYSRHPAISVPAGLSKSGLPVGIQLIAGHYRDALVLQAAAAVEEVRPPAR